MSDLFSKEWMLGFQHEWNNDTEFAKELAQISFDSMIGYGFTTESEPRGIIEVKKGKVTSAGKFAGESLNWDLRAEQGVWSEWFEYPPGMMALGIAYTSQKLKFNKGDYASMIKDPSVAGPFIKSFVVMSRVQAN